MDSSKKVAVIIPFYKPELTAYESIVLQQCFRVLPAYPVIAIKPESLVLPGEVTKYPFFDTASFDDEYFNNVQGYNRLMLDELFYKQFLDYEYILIYQLDAFVFKDELAYWCSQDIDYVGAPWIRAYKYPPGIWQVKQIQHYFHARYDVQKNGLPSEKQFAFKVGNGGFSLRRTKKFYELCLSNKDKIAAYNANDHHLYNEDMFWSLEVNRKRKVLNIPSYKIGLRFSVEFAPARAFSINNNQLPFGCHAWDKSTDFWRPIFKEQGYDI